MRTRNGYPLVAAAAAALLAAGCGGAEGGKDAGAVLEVGGLPVTCNLSLPVACMAMQNAADSAGGAVAMAGMDMAGMDMSAMSMDDMDGMSIGGLAVYRKYNGWPEIKEAMMSGRLQAAYLLAPMAMELADRGIPVRVVAIGHRSGAVIMVHHESTARNIGDLRGQRIAIPSRFAVDYLFVRRMMERHGLKDGDIEFVEMPPPDMPVALHTRTIDGYATGEPFGAKAQMAGYARALHMTRDEWPDYICCVLTVRQELIDQHPEQVQKLVDYVISAGDWLDSNQANRHTAAELASHPSFFGQDPRVLKFVMDNPPDRVTYGDLRLVRHEFDAVMLAQFGITEAVATLGTATTREHLQLLFKSTSKVVFCFDGDRAGRAAAWRALDQALPEVHEGRECVFMFLPDGHDPDTLVQEIGAEAFRARIQQALPLSQFLLGELSRQVNLGTLEGRARLLALARPHLDKLREGPLRTLMLDELARLARMGRNDVETALRRADTPTERSAPESSPAAAPVPGASRPVRRLMQLLLERPDLAEDVDNLQLLTQADVPGIDVLIDALDFFHAHPNARAAQLVEVWKDSAKGRAVSRLLAEGPLGLDDDAVEAEFREAIQRLSVRALETEANRLLAESAHRELSAAEIEIIRSFHAARPARSRR